MLDYRVFHGGKYMGRCNERPPEIDFTDNCHCEQESGKACHYIHVYRLRNVVMTGEVSEFGAPVMNMYYEIEQATEIVETMQ